MNGHPEMVSSTGRSWALRRAGRSSSMFVACKRAEALARGVAETPEFYRELKPPGNSRRPPSNPRPRQRRYRGGWRLQAHRRVSGASLKMPGKLLLGAATKLRKIAAILDRDERRKPDSVGALEAADAWIDHSAASANVIAATLTDRAATRSCEETPQRYLTALKALGGDIQAASSCDVRRKIIFYKKRFQICPCSSLKLPAVFG